MRLRGQQDWPPVEPAQVAARDVHPPPAAAFPAPSTSNFHRRAAAQPAIPSLLSFPECVFSLRFCNYLFTFPRHLPEHRES
jgi:hypothetical protein